MKTTSSTLNREKNERMNDRKSGECGERVRAERTREGGRGGWRRGERMALPVGFVSGSKLVKTHATVFLTLEQSFPSYRLY